MFTGNLVYFSRAQAIGVLTSALFVGGNIVVSFVDIPSLKWISVPLDRAAVFTSYYHRAARTMIGLGGTATLGFGLAAYWAPTEYLRNSMIGSTLLAASIIPFTLFSIIPTVQKIIKIQKENDALKASTDGDKLYEKWNISNYIRLTIMAVACLNGLRDLSEWNVW